MKTTLEKRPKQLSPAEWNFSELKDEELQLGFFYEYGRSSDKVKFEVEKMRAARPHPRVWPYCPRDNHIFEIIHWLAEQEPHFPETAWLTLKANAIAEIQIKRAEARRIEAQANATLPPGQKFCAGMEAGQPGDPVESIEWMVRAVRGSNVHLRISGSAFWQVWRGDPKAYKAWHDNEARTFSELSAIGGEFMAAPASSRVWGAIDWRATDAEIIERFKWLLKCRPAQFRDCAKTPAVQRGYDISFPFRISSALAWLSVFRRRQAAKTWREYMELYNQAALNNLGKNTVKSRDISDLAIPREADCRKARLILEWFDKGTQLKKKDFR